MTGPRSIAIVGVAGRFPDAPDVAALWANVVANRSAAREVTEARWSVPVADVVRHGGGAVADHASSSHACLLGDFDLDGAGDALPKEWLPRLSRHARLTLRVGVDAWNSVRSKNAPERASVILANIALPTDGASAVAEELFFGPLDAAIDDRALVSAAEPLDAFPGAIPAGLLAHALGIGGGSFTLDAACASSLYAIHLACADLEAGRVDAVLCGGVSLPQSLYTQVGFTQLQALSASGRSAPYDESADGLVVGEGAAMVVLKRLSDAERDGDVVLAVVRGIGLSNDVGGSLLSPESEGQLRAMRAAYEQAGWRPEDVDLIEGHGTGTPRGDTVELESLAELWRGVAAESRGCVLGSVKSNIGHLLTAAGVAGLCKVLGAFKAQKLPPSRSTDAPRPARALREGPFRVLASAERWQPRSAGVRRRAAISGFGFGGINAHLLLEEPPIASEATASPAVARVTSAPGVRPCPIAIVGMAAHVGRLDSLASFERAVLRGDLVDDALPEERWHGLDRRPHAERMARLRTLRGAWIESIALPSGRFKLPPNDVGSLLPQQLLTLKVAGEALLDASAAPGSIRGPHLRFGAVVGLGLDLESTSFHLRWLSLSRVRRWASSLGLGLTESELEAWAEQLRDALAPALDATRTLGALGGIVPSRVAREFQLGGPSFAVADEEASGLRALEIAVRMLQRGEVDGMLACAVDLAGDVRSVLASDALRPFSPSGHARPFDERADGTKIAEGAVAVVLKRLDDAVRAGDRVYAVVRGVGVAGGGALDAGMMDRREQAYVRAARSAYADAGVSPGRVGLVETHGSAVPGEDAIEGRALAQVFADSGERGSIALGSLAAVVGQAGVAASLASVVKAALCLQNGVLPPVGRVLRPIPSIASTGTPFHLPCAPEAWLRDRVAGPRVAGVSTMGKDGTCIHAVLEAHDAPAVATRPPRSRGRALGPRSSALFLLRDDRDVDALRALASAATDVESLAATWHREGVDRAAAVGRAVVASDVADLQAQLARGAAPRRETFDAGSVAFVFPGSGNHYVGMGRELALALPDVYRTLDEEVLHLEGHLHPAWIAPRRTSWADDWEEDARRELRASPERVIVAQVAHSVAVHDALVYLGVRPDAFIGYSLGESAALFASRTWRDRDVMFARTLASPLFRTELCGTMSVLKAAWGEGADWKVVIVTRPASEVRGALEGTAALLIVNAPRECVLGGLARDIDATIARLACEAIVLDSVPTVHLSLARAVRDAYRAHHLLVTKPPAGVRFYSGAWATSYEPTDSMAADSLTENAMEGFDFPAVIDKAWADGARVFVEVGPQGSCTRMIGRILEGRPHLAVSACQRGYDGYRTLLLVVGRLAEAGVPVDLDRLYGDSNGALTAALATPALLPRVVLGGARPEVPLRPPMRTAVHASAASKPVRPANGAATVSDRSSALAAFFTSNEATIAAHEAFLRVAHEGLALQTRLVSGREGLSRPLATLGTAVAEPVPPRFDRASCVEFAVGKLARVLGEAFADVDSYPSRVRLPDEPLMLVDRIVSVEGTLGTLGPGRVVTEHDVLENAWYLDGYRAPVCISVEAGQADLFLSAYLGIDHQTRGERVYRLLDAKIVFHRDLPRPGERIRYDIRIDRFLCQGDTWLFFFRFDGSIDGRGFITMFDGCAGFFSAEQLATGRGIVPRSATSARITHPRAASCEPFHPLVPMARASLSDQEVDALRRGDLGAAFGSAFAGKTLAPSLRLPGGRMKLVHRIVAMDAAGGPSALGEVIGEADVTPDAWYLICHFKGDEVMPGTLMYECCLHTLRVLLLGLGWISTDATTDLHYGPVAEVASELRCRGQVTAETKTVRYRVSIEQIGYDPEPFVIASASMFADDKHVVQMDGMSLKLRGMSRARVESEWRALPVPTGPAFDRAKVVAYAEGKPSECFGERYRPFDHERRLARLPRDPYLFLDRVVAVEPPPWVLAPGGWVTCEHDVDPDAWYFGAGAQGTMPFAVLLEAALQPCGWLAAYLGSALLSDVDLKFRNLDGHGTQLVDVHRDAGTLTTRARLTKTSQAGGMILQEFDLEVLRGRERVYVGQTGFGFFPAAALAAQVGLRGASSWGDGAGLGARTIEQRGADSPARSTARAIAAPGLTLPERTLLMIDELLTLELAGGPRGLGAAAATKRVDSVEWFFRAHFYQDPVMPGSLGLEALLSLMKVFSRERFPHLCETHTFQAMALGRAHRWQYRGQVIPTNESVRIEMRVTAIDDGDDPTVAAEGQLSVDGKMIYAMSDFTVRLVRRASR